MTIIRERSRRFIPGAHVEQLTLSGGDATFQNPFAPSSAEDLFLTITQYMAASPVAEYFDWSMSGNTITITSSNGSSTATVQIKVEGS